MSTPARITAFAVGLALLFTVAAVAGGAVDPDIDDGSTDHGMESEEKTMDTHESMSVESELPAGLASSTSGFRIEPAATTAERSRSTRYRFTIVGADGDPVTEYDREHDRRMHLIVVRRDFAGFQHVHPELGPDGTWTVAIDTSLPGTYRVFADFTTGGESMTLATDLTVPGRVEPQPLAPPQATASAGDGYEVTVSSPDPRPGGATRTEFTITRNGEPIDRVQPYLGADGHLVVLREGDLAFLHAHPQGEPGGTGPIAFDVDYPSAGAYRMFLQFRHRGEIRTASFTELAGDASPAGAEGHNGNGANHAH